MNMLEKKSGIKHMIIDNRGKVEYVLLPVKRYEKIMAALEDYGLGRAMKEAENSKILNKKAALEFLKHA